MVKVKQQTDNQTPWTAGKKSHPKKARMPPSCYQSHSYRFQWISLWGLVSVFAVDWVGVCDCPEIKSERLCVCRWRHCHEKTVATLNNTLSHRISLYSIICGLVLGFNFQFSSNCHLKKQPSIFNDWQSKTQNSLHCHLFGMNNRKKWFQILSTALSCQ